MGERSWEVLILLTLSSAAFLMMYVGVSNWVEVDQPGYAVSHTPGEQVTYHRPGGESVPPGSVADRVRLYFDQFADFLGSQLETPHAYWSREEDGSKGELDSEAGVVATVASFCRGIGDSIKNWGQKTISPPSIFHAAEPLGRSNHDGMVLTFGLMDRVNQVVRKVMEENHADAVVLGREKTCLETLEEQMMLLIRSLKYGLNEQVCNGELRTVNERAFCNFFKSYPKLAVLMVLSKLKIDPVGVAVMRTSTSQCAYSDDRLLLRIRKMEKIARRVVSSGSQEGFEGESVGHQRELWERDLLPGVWREHRSCSGSQSDEKIKAGVLAACEAPSACMAKTCAFIEEHRYLSKVFFISKLQPWEAVSVACEARCHGSSFLLSPLQDGYDNDVAQTAVSEIHAPNLPWIADAIMRRFDREQAGYEDPALPLVPGHVDSVSLDLSRANRLLRLARLQAFRRVMQLRGNRLDLDRSYNYGNGQGHLVVVVNGHWFHPSSVLDMISSLQEQLDTGFPRDVWSEMLVVKPVKMFVPVEDMDRGSQSTSFEGQPELLGGQPVTAESGTEVPLVSQSSGVTDGEEGVDVGPQEISWEVQPELLENKLVAEEGKAVETFEVVPEIPLMDDPMVAADDLTDLKGATDDISRAGVEEVASVNGNGGADSNMVYHSDEGSRAVI